MKLLLTCAVLIACHHDPAPSTPSVVFVCEHGAAKSVVASEYFNKLAAERGLAVRAIARGADPQADLSFAAVKGLRADGLPPSLPAPRPLTAPDLRSSSQVVAFDCGQPAMTALKAMGACWDDVPTVGDDYGRARDRIRAHVEQLVAELAAPSR